MRRFKNYSTSVLSPLFDDLSENSGWEGGVNLFISFLLLICICLFFYLLWGFIDRLGGNKTALDVMLEGAFIVTLLGILILAFRVFAKQFRRTYSAISVVLLFVASALICFTFIGMSQLILGLDYNMFSSSPGAAYTCYELPDGYRFANACVSKNPIPLASFLVISWMALSFRRFYVLCYNDDLKFLYVSIIPYILLFIFIGLKLSTDAEFGVSFKDNLSKWTSSFFIAAMLLLIMAMSFWIISPFLKKEAGSASGDGDGDGESVGVELIEGPSN